MSIALSACAPSAALSTKALYYMPDPTTDTVQLPTASEVMCRLGLGSDRWRGGIVVVSPVGETGYGKSVRMEIPPVRFPLLDNPQERDSLIQTFSSDVEVKLNSVRKSAGVTAHSEVYRHFARMLNTLAEEAAADKEFESSSDLAELNYSLDFYRRDTGLLYSHPEVLEGILDSIQPLHDLSGVTVRLVYQPRDNEDSRRYEAISAIYRHMIEAHHGRVVISGGAKNIRP